ncbi:hypothetical protein G9A89_002219 [Geosiphon pyriformis]|nr:hypothetical protein G9A89_002219 [Geosiphon pyriformis]
MMNLKGEGTWLFSCALVNRTWCRMVIPILWSQPFLLFQSLLNSHTAKLSFAMTLLSCLTKDSKDKLKRIGIEIPRYYDTTIFDYLALITELWLPKLQEIISIWVHKFREMNELAKPSDIYISKISNFLSDEILSRSENFHHLNVTIFEPGTYHFPDLTKYLNIAKGLEKLKRFKLDLSFRGTYSLQRDNLSWLLCAMNMICKHIVSLDITLDAKFPDIPNSMINQISRLIKLQHKLQNLSISSNLKTPLLLEPLHYQAHTLKIIKLHDLKITTKLLEDMTNCLKLESLAFVFCSLENLDLESWIPFIESQIQLKTMCLRNFYFPPQSSDLEQKSFLMFLIRKMGNQLRELELFTHFGNQMPLLTQINCHNLEILRINSSMRNFPDENLDFLANANSLSELKISFFRRSQLSHKFWARLAQNFPLHLTIFESKISPSELKVILENQRSKLQIIVVQTHRKNEHLEIVQNFFKESGQQAPQIL